MNDFYHVEKPVKLSTWLFPRPKTPGVGAHRVALNRDREGNIILLEISRDKIIVISKDKSRILLSHSVETKPMTEVSGLFVGFNKATPLIRNFTYYSFCPPKVGVEKFHPREWRKWVESVYHHLPRFLDMLPNL